MARVNTILLAIIAIAVVGWVGRILYQNHKAEVVYNQMFAPTQWDPAINPPPPDPQLPQIPPKR